MKRIAVCLAAVLAVSTTASANVEVGGIAGFHQFSEDSSLGEIGQMPTTQKNSAFFGARLGYYLKNNIGIEVEAGVIPTEPRSMTFDVWDITYRAQIVYQLAPKLADKTLIPFVEAGGGAVQIVSSQQEQILKKDSKFIGYIGIGAKYQASGNWGVRVDLRAVADPKRGGGIAPELEVLTALYREFGRVEHKHHEEKKIEEKHPVESDEDHDGLVGAQDKCPKEAEDKDGFQDDDGCPDEIPAKVKQFTGAVQGITFKVSSADLLPASNKTLDKAVAVLKEFPDLKMEIQGHTDDQPLKKGGKFEDNQALSQARAESVMNYFVKAGIDAGRITAKGYGDTMPVEAPTGLKGAKLNAAREKNRRVEFKLISPLTQPDSAAAPAAPAPAATPAAPATPAPAAPAAPATDKK